MHNKVGDRSAARGRVNAAALAVTNTADRTRLDLTVIMMWMDLEPSCLVEFVRTDLIANSALTSRIQWMCCYLDTWNLERRKERKDTRNETATESEERRVSESYSDYLCVRDGSFCVLHNIYFLMAKDRHNSTILRLFYSVEVKFVFKIMLTLATNLVPSLKAPALTRFSPLTSNR